MSQRPLELSTGTDSYRLGRTLLAMMLLVAIDAGNFFDRGGPARYLLLVIPLGSIAFTRLRYRSSLIRRMSFPDKVLLTFMLYGLAGAIYGAAFRHTHSTALPIFIPMLVGFTYLGTVHRPTDAEVGKLLRGLAWVGLIYTLMNAFANTGVVHAVLAANSYRNSKVLFILTGISAAINLRKRALLAVMIALAAFVYATYPSGTDAAVTLVAIITFWMTKPGRSSLRPYVIGILGVAIIGIAVFNLTRTTSLASSYFELVGKKNNSNARLALWRGGLAEFRQSPVYGTAFTGEITILVYRRGLTGAPFKAPFHDDYVMLLAVGGAIGFGICLWWIIATERNILRRYTGFIAAGDRSHAMMLRTLLVGFNVLFTAALFNPELSAVGRSCTLFGMYAMIMMLGEPTGQPQQQPAKSLATASSVPG